MNDTIEITNLPVEAQEEVKNETKVYEDGFTAEEAKEIELNGSFPSAA